MSRKNRKVKQGKTRFWHRNLTSSETRTGIVMFVLLCLATYFVLPISRVNSVVVTGNIDTSQTEILSASNIKENQILLGKLLQTDTIKENVIASNARIQSVDVYTKNYNTVELSVTEYETVAYVMYKGDYVSALSNGLLLQDSNYNYIGGVPSITWSENMNSLQIMIQELAKVDKALRQQISDISYHESNGLVMTLYMKDGNQVKVNYTHFSEKLAYYTSMKAQLNNRQGVIDLTVGAYFSPYR